MRRPLYILCTLSLVLLPELATANGPPVPAPLWYLRQPDKKANPRDIAYTPEKYLHFHRDAPVSLVYRHDIERPKLIIPRKFVAIDPKAKAEAEPNSPRSLFVGLALSAAFVTGGFWLVRRSGNLGKTALVGSILGAMVILPLFLSSVFSNTPPPGMIRPSPAKIEGDTVNLGMHLFIVEEGDRIELQLPKQLMPATMIPRDEFEKRAIDPVLDRVKIRDDGKKKDEKK